MVLLVDFSPVGVLGATASGAVVPIAALDFADQLPAASRARTL